jgi:hypothetical protein
MIDPFYAGVYWSARRESLQECARRVTAVLRALSGCNPSSARWFRKGMDRAGALQHEVAINEQSIATILLEGRVRGDYSGEVFEDGGFSLDLWNGASQGREMAISIRCGAYSPWLTNRVVLDLPLDRKESADIMNFLALRRILVVLVRCFKPDWGAVTHADLRDGILRTPTGEPTAGWLTYLSRKYGAAFPDGGHEVERVDNLGELLIATREHFDLSRADHVGATLKVAERIRASEQSSSGHHLRN